MGIEPSARRRNGFTLVELLVVIAIVAILASMMLPALGRAKQRAKRTGCLSNLRQVYLAVALYADDHRDSMPVKYEVKKDTLKSEDYAKGKRLQTLPDGIHTFLADYTGGSESGVFHCLSDRGDSVAATPVFERKGTSYQVEGVDTGRKPQDQVKNKLSANSRQDIAFDLFKPWDSDDPEKVAEKVAKGELGPVLWHERVFNKAMGDGRILSIRTKAEDKLAKGEIPKPEDY